jgi:hypothetical protein
MEGYEPQRMLTIPDLKGDMHLSRIGCHSVDVEISVWLVAFWFTPVVFWPLIAFLF